MSHSSLDTSPMQQQRDRAVRLLKDRLTWSPSIAHLGSTFRLHGTNPDAGLPEISLFFDREALAGSSSRESEERHVPPVPLLPENQENFRQLLDLISGVVAGGVSSSVFLIGPRGSGKSTVAHCALLRALYDSSIHTSQKTVLPLYVNARFMNDEQHALNSICEQLREAIERLCENRGVEDESFQQHISGCKDIRALVEIYSSLSVSDGVVEASGIISRAVILVLDEFDLFASRTRQTLLYSIFDTIQSPTGSLAVICLSCRHDVELLLEKRVRSRHTGRKLVFVPPTKAELLDLSESIMVLPPVYPQESSETYPQQGVHTSSSSSSIISSWPNFASPFNESVRKLLSSSGPISQPLNMHLEMDLSPASMSNLLFRTVCNMASRQGNYLTLKDFESVAMKGIGTTRMQTLLGLSVLELLLLVAMRRLEQRERSAYNFTIVFEEYRACAKQIMSGGSSDEYSKEASMHAFQRLLEQGLVVPASTGGGRKDMPECVQMQCTVFPVEIEFAVENHKQCPTKVRTLFAQEINPGLSSASLW